MWESLFRIEWVNAVCIGPKASSDVKVIPGKEVAMQHQLLVCDMRIDVPPKSKRKFIPRLKVWRLKDHHEQLFPGDIQLACKCLCRCSWCYHWGYLEQHQEWPAQDNWSVWHNSPVLGVLKPCGGMSMWKRPSMLPRGKISRPGRLVKALEHHTKQPNAFPDIHCTMYVNKKAYENIDRKTSDVYRPAN